MKAIDTSIVVRYLTGDDPRQAPRARAVVDAGDIFVSITVLLEAEWVLCSVYGFSGQDVAAALRAFSGLPGVFVENPALLAVALDHAAAGMDFAVRCTSALQPVLQPIARPCSRSTVASLSRRTIHPSR